MDYYYLYHDGDGHYDVYALYEDRDDAQEMSDKIPGSEIISLVLITKKERP